MDSVAQDPVIVDLVERVDALELMLAKYTRSNGKPKAKKPAAAKSPGAPRWLSFVKFANHCQHPTCGDLVNVGARAYYVPNVGLYHESCAPAEAQAARAA